MIEVDNKWLNSDSAYKGIHLNVMTPNGIRFEVQIHSNESLLAKNSAHTFYEELRATPKGSHRRFELEEKIRNVFSKLVSPENIEKL